jgi:hypothetical protein
MFSTASAFFRDDFLGKVSVVEEGEPGREN